MNAYTTMADVRLHTAATRADPSAAAVTQPAETAGSDVDGPVDMRWIPFFIPLLGAVTASMPYLVLWSVSAPQ